MKSIYQYKLTLVISVGILIAVLLPGSDVPSVGIPHLDKVVHFGMFGTVTMCYIWEYVATKHHLPLFWQSSLCLIGFGAFTEILQYFVPGRSCDLKDLTCDAVGILVLGYCMRTYIIKHRKG